MKLNTWQQQSENPSVISWRERLDRQTETFTDRLAGEDSVGEFAEVEQLFRQSPPSQTHFLAFFFVPASKHIYHPAFVGL